MSCVREAVLRVAGGPCCSRGAGQTSSFITVSRGAVTSWGLWLRKLALTDCPRSGLRLGKAGAGLSPSERPQWSPWWSLLASDGGVSEGAACRAPRTSVGGCLQAHIAPWARPGRSSVPTWLPSRRRGPLPLLQRPPTPAVSPRHLSLSFPGTRLVALLQGPAHGLVPSEDVPGISSVVPLTSGSFLFAVTLRESLVCVSVLTLVSGPFRCAGHWDSRPPGSQHVPRVCAVAWTQVRVGARQGPAPAQGHPARGPECLQLPGTRAPSHP